LIKFKPWFSDKTNICRGTDNTVESIIKLWEDHIENIITSSQRSPDYLQVEINSYLDNKSTPVHKVENNDMNNNFEEENEFEDNVSAGDS